MTLLKTLPALILLPLTTLAIAQAPIVRQAPSDSQPPQYAAPPPDQQPNQQPYPQPDQQANQAPLPPMSPQELDRLVSRIALYPDPLLAQTLTAATYWDEIAEAAQWADQHAALKGEALNQAMLADNLPWDPSVLALLPFPSVLDMMAQDPNWTGQLGNAVLGQRAEVMDAVQRLRRRARSAACIRCRSGIGAGSTDGTESRP